MLWFIKRIIFSAQLTHSLLSGMSLSTSRDNYYLVLLVYLLVDEVVGDYMLGRGCIRGYVGDYMHCLCSPLLYLFSRKIGIGKLINKYVLMIHRRGFIEFKFNRGENLVSLEAPI